MSGLVARAVGWRHGVVADLGPVPATFADPPIANWGAATHPLAGGASAGGAGRDDDLARAAAVGEAVERYTASTAPLPVVEPAPGDEVVAFDPGYHGTGPLSEAYSALDNRLVLVPVSLLTLDPARSSAATSNGLAADPSPRRALLRAVQELVERDALVTTWLHGVAARMVDAGPPAVLDLTPAWSPHPVAAVAGTLPLRGRPRHSLGLACRARWADAVDKAWLEWAQGCVFAGLAGLAEPAAVPDVPTTFDEHAAYYTAHPDQWDCLPLWGGPRVDPPPDAADPSLAGLVAALARGGVDVYYRDLTTVDAAHIGLRVVRALSPQLVPIHADHRRPFLGGTVRDLSRRYPWARAGAVFPNPAPHPLG